MIILGTHHILPLLSTTQFSAKLVFNAHGAIFCPVSKEHRDLKATNISYEDDCKGNALAAMLSPARIEIRYHQDFTDTEVSRILSELRQQVGVEFMSDWRATYQGRALELDQ